MSLKGSSRALVGINLFFFFNLLKNSDPVLEDLNLPKTLSFFSAPLVLVGSNLFSLLPLVVK